MTDDGMSQNHLTCTEAKLTNIESLRPKHSEVSSLLVIFDQAPQGNWTCLMEYFSSLSSAALIPISASVVLTFCQSRTRTHTRIYTRTHACTQTCTHTHTHVHALTRSHGPNDRTSAHHGHLHSLTFVLYRVYVRVCAFLRRTLGSGDISQNALRSHSPP